MQIRHRYAFLDEAGIAPQCYMLGPGNRVVKLFSKAQNQIVKYFGGNGVLDERDERAG